MNTESHTEKNERDLLDLLTIIAGWISRLMRAIAGVLIGMLRLTVRHWVIALLPTLLSMALGIYLVLPGHRYYQAQAIAMLQIAPNDHYLAEQVYKELGEAWNVPDENLPNSLAHILGIPVKEAMAVRKFLAYDVIANQIDASWVDYEGYAKHLQKEDTTTVLVKRKLALTFETKHPENIATIEQAILNYMNANPNLIVRHQAFRQLLEEQHAFHTQQLQLLDSVSRAFYAAQIKATPAYAQQGTNIVVGRQEIALMNNDIQTVLQDKGNLEIELTMCTAPIVLENGFIVNAMPVRHPLFFPLEMLLLGWMIGILLAFCADNRKRWWSMLKG